MEDLKRNGLTSLTSGPTEPVSDLQSRIRRLQELSRSTEARPNEGDTEDPSVVDERSDGSSPRRSVALPEIDNLTNYAEQITDEVYIPPLPPSYGELSKPFHPAIQAWLSSSGMRLYSHQAEAIESFRSGHNVALATQTASGKSLAFNLPTIEVILEVPDSTALYIYPAKALANDQLVTFIELDQRLGLGTLPASYDGDTSKSDRKLIKSDSRVVVTNPHGLHLYLGWNASWARFLSNLKVVVIDEAHYYSGTVGTHMAMLVRRLRRLCEHYGSDPQFFLASATIANPKEHAEALCGVDFDLINSRGSARPGRWFVFWDTKKDLGHSATTQVSSLTRQLVRYNRQVIVFSDTRHQAEMIAKASSDRVHRVSAYRAGYSAETRRRIESELKGGRLRGVSSTSALELGVDIGGIDTVVMNGVPSSVASFWQRAGRGGRSGQDATVVICAGSDPISRYMLKHPSHLLESSSEEAIVNTEHTQTISQHLVCAASELPLTKSDSKYFGQQTAQIVESLIEDDSLESSEDGTARYVRRGRPQFSVSLSGTAEAQYQLEAYDGTKSRPLEKLGAGRAMREAHPGAIFHHQGIPYRVNHVDHSRLRISVSAEKSANFTVAASLRNLLPDPPSRSAVGGAGTIFTWGRAIILESVIGYKEYSPNREEPKRHSVETPSRSYATEAVTITLPKVTSVNVDDDDKDSQYPGAHAAEHALSKVLPLLYIADRKDSGALTLKNQNQPTICIFDLTEGGTGISKVAFSRIDDLLARAVDLIQECECSTGCPNCIFDSSCRDDQIDKQLGLQTLKFLQSEASSISTTT